LGVSRCVVPGNRVGREGERGMGVGAQCRGPLVGGFDAKEKNEVGRQTSRKDVLDTSRRRNINAITENRERGFRRKQSNRSEENKRKVFAGLVLFAYTSHHYLLFAISRSTNCPSHCLDAIPRPTPDPPPRKDA